jgi:hypothetical protein
VFDAAYVERQSEHLLALASQRMQVPIRVAQNSPSR